MRILATLHRWLGAAAASVLLVVAISGGLLLFADDYHRWRLPQLTEYSSAPPLSVEALAAVVSSAAGAAGTIAMPRDTLPAYIRYRSEGGQALFDPLSGSQIAQWGPLDTIPGFAFEAHAHLLAGDSGHLGLGFIGLLAAAMVLSGLWLWWPRRQQLPLRTWLPRKTNTAALLRAHSAQGALLGAGMLFLAMTGSAMVFDSQAQAGLSAAFGQDGQTRPARHQLATSVPIKAIDWSRVLEASRAAFPEATLRMITLPRSREQPLILRLRQPAELHPNGRSYLVIDPLDARVIERIDATRAGWGPAIYNSLYPLHAGKTGWIGHRPILVMIAASLAWLCISGLWLFVRRQRRP